MDMEKKGLIRSYETEFAFLFRLADIGIIGGSLFVLTLLYVGEFNRDYNLIGVIAIISYLLGAESANLYRSWRTNTLREQCQLTLLPWFVATVILLALGYFTKTGVDFSRVVIGAWFVVAPILLMLWRCVYRFVLLNLRKQGFNTRRAVIIGFTEHGLKLAREIERNNQHGVVLDGFYDERNAERLQKSTSYKILGNVEKALERAKNGEIEHVYIAMPLHANKRISDFLARFSDTTANTYLVPDFFTYNLLHSRWHHIGDVHTLSVFDTPFNGFSSWIKRVEDIVLSSIILLMISPVLAAVALGVKLSSPGPVLFKQDRYGLDGRKIKVWKFRSMKVMDNGAVVKQATKNDPRVTRFGAFIRRTSLDELPQFFNVLQGSMSIVGPRPHAVSHNEEFRQIVDRYMLRHKVKPGITGWAQVNGYRGETDTIDKMEKRVEFDLAYIQNWSFGMDLKIVFLTIFKGFTGKAAY